MATFFLDYEGGNNANDGTSFANRWKDLTSGATAARIAPGDTVKVMKSPDATSLGMTATWTKKSATVTLNSALNATITNCDSAWTAAANVTATASTTRREGTNSASLAIAAGFTTGKCAYFATGTLNLSAYQGITLWYRTNLAVAASTLSIRLCSDTTGDVTVDTLALPAISQTGQWIPVHIDKGSALGASIQSIALYADLDPGTVTVLLDNISTTKAAGNDCLTLKSLIGKNTALETWWALRAISGTTLTLDMHSAMDASGASTWKGYWGTTETVTTYHRKTIPTDLVATSASTAIQAIQDSGTLAGGYITISGGWDRTNMTTQDGETWFDGQSANARGIYTNAKNYIKFEKINLVRYSTGWWNDGSYNWWSGACAANNNINGFWAATVGSGTDPGIPYIHVEDMICAGNNFGFGGQTVFHPKLDKIRCYSNGNTVSGDGFNISGIDGGSEIGEIDSANSNWSALVIAGTLTGRIETINAEDAQHGCSLGNALDCYVDTVTVKDITAINSVGFGTNHQYRNYFIRELNTHNCVHGLWLTNADQGKIVIGTHNATGTGSSIRHSTVRNEVCINHFNDSTGTGHSFDSGAHCNGWLRIDDYDGSGLARNYWGAGNGSGGVQANATIFEVQDANRHTLTGSAWEIKVKNTTWIYEKNPVVWPVGTYYAQASSTVTAKIWVKRSNTELILKFVARKGQLAGMTTDYIATISAGADTYEELSISFTPTEAGVVQFEIWAYGGSTRTGHVDDMSVTQ